MKLKILSARELMAEWGTPEALAIIKAIEDGLTCYEKTLMSSWDPRSKGPGAYDLQKVEQANIEERYEQGVINLDRLVFYRIDVDRYVAENGFTPLSGDDKRRLGFLEHEMKKRDAALEAAFYLGGYWQRLGGGKIERIELEKEYLRRFSDRKKHPKTAFGRIWEMVPKDLKYLDGTHKPPQTLS